MKLEFTEEYLQGNYQRYLENMAEDKQPAKPYTEWRAWFLETFGPAKPKPKSRKSKIVNRKS